MTTSEDHDPPAEDLGEREYVRRVLEGYLRTPTTVHQIRAGDRAYAVELYRAGVPVRLVEDALVLGAVRRLFRPWDAPRLEAVRSLRYFGPIIEELRREPPPEGYLECQRWKLRNLDFYHLTLDEEDRLRPLGDAE